MYENYPGNIHEAYSILPDMDIVVNSLEIYNSVLMIHEQLGNTDLTSYMDNRAVMKVMKRRRRG